MKPELAIFDRVISEKRAAAARVNGAKSRGPVSASGKANSSRNSRRHGLRSNTLLADPGSADRLTAILASFEREFQPQSQIERTLIGTMALASSRRTGLWKLEKAEVNLEIGRLKSLAPADLHQDVTLIALAFRSLSGNGCSLDLIGRLESRFERQYDRAFDRLTAHQLRRAQSAKKVNSSERTRQTAENTKPHPAPAAFSA